MTKKYKYVTGSPEWEKRANAEARNYVEISTCVQCGAPVVKGYCCNECHSSDPSGTIEERNEYYNWIYEQKKPMRGIQ